MDPAEFLQAWDVEAVEAEREEEKVAAGTTVVPVYGSKNDSGEGASTLDPLALWNYGQNTLAPYGIGDSGSTLEPYGIIVDKTTQGLESTLDPYGGGALPLYGGGAKGSKTTAGPEGLGSNSTIPANGAGVKGSETTVDPYGGGVKGSEYPVTSDDGGLKGSEPTEASYVGGVKIPETTTGYMLTPYGVKGSGSTSASYGATTSVPSLFSGLVSTAATSLAPDGGGKGSGPTYASTIAPSTGKGTNTSISLGPDEGVKGLKTTISPTLAPYGVRSTSGPVAPSLAPSTKCSASTRAPCQALVSSVLSSCSPLVSPNQYMVSCERELCQGPADPQEVVCQWAGEYATTCRQEGLCLEWREALGCPTSSCPPNTHYEECGPGCEATCGQATCGAGQGQEPACYCDQDMVPMASCIPGLTLLSEGAAAG